MDEYDKLPDIKMTALAVMFQMKKTSRKTSKAANFVVKEALSEFTALLEDDDLGYLYNPQHPKHLCVHPGELCGMIGNSTLPYDFNFLDGLKHLSYVLNALDTYDYNKVCLIVTDCFDPSYASFIIDFLNEVDAKVFVYEVGKGEALELACKAVGAGYERLEDAADLSERLVNIRESFSNSTRKWE